MFKLLEKIIEIDKPFFGACYGVGTVGKFCGGVVSKEKYSEDVSAKEIFLSEDGKKDKICRGLPESFYAIVGHKEACQILPPDATLLASSKTCPVQLFKIKENIYSSQFHPELDIDGLRVRMEIYNNMGYFEADEFEQILNQAGEKDLSKVVKILENFSLIYKK
jgi:GMP synthase (glutamine-hydrolysing)